tara:strand:+ start:854 stop:1051 length:198 start_codon:yes stop_codon:yes gene_type:complete
MGFDSKKIVWWDFPPELPYAKTRHGKIREYFAIWEDTSNEKNDNNLRHCRASCDIKRRTGGTKER